MSLKRILGTVLASRMGGHGGRRGGLGSSGGLFGGSSRRRRSGIGGKSGIAALGLMAFRAYQDHQSRTATRTGSGPSATGSATPASSESTGSSGGIGGMVQDLADRLTGKSGTDETRNADMTPQPEPAVASEEETRQDEQAAESMSDQKALLLIRAMITAAYSDGAMSTDERKRIMQEINDGGADEDDRRTMEREIANPKELDELLVEVNDTETAEQFYLASRAAVDGQTETNRGYLAALRERLNLTSEQAAEIDELAA